MLKIQRILFATDFSPAAKTAFRYAAHLAQKLKIPLDVLHVVPSIGASRFEVIDPVSGGAMPGGTATQALEGFRALVTEEVHEVPTRYLVGYGPLPGPVILDQASLAESNLIVLGATGQGASQNPLLGSVAAELMQRSTCPVFMVPSGASEAAIDEKMERVLTFVSFAHLLQPVILFALKLATLFGAHLDVLALTEMKPGEGADAEMIRKLEQKLWSIVEAEGREEETSIALDSIRLHFQAETDVDYILDFAREHKSDVLVVESPALGPAESPKERMLERIVSEAPCPVVLVNTCGKAFKKPASLKPRKRQTTGVA